MRFVSLLVRLSFYYLASDGSNMIAQCVLNPPASGLLMNDPKPWDILWPRVMPDGQELRIYPDHWSSISMAVGSRPGKHSKSILSPLDATQYDINKLDSGRRYFPVNAGNDKSLQALHFKFDTSQCNKPEWEEWSYLPFGNLLLGHGLCWEWENHLGYSSIADFTGSHSITVDSPMRVAHLIWQDIFEPIDLSSIVVASTSIISDNIRLHDQRFQVERRDSIELESLLLGFFASRVITRDTSKSGLDSDAYDTITYHTISKDTLQELWRLAVLEVHEYDVNFNGAQQAAQKQQEARTRVDNIVLSLISVSLASSSISLSKACRYLCF